MKKNVLKTIAGLIALFGAFYIIDELSTPKKDPIDKFLDEWKLRKH